MAEGSISFAKKGGVCFIRMSGVVRHTISPGFDRLLDHLFSDAATDEIVLDVNQARNIDSTNLGLMAKVARFMLEQRRRKPVILCENPDVRMLLDSMGFGRIFEIVSHSIAGRLQFETARHVEQTHKERIHMILDAHRVLMEMNNHNRALFEPVVDALEDELE